MSTWTFKYPLYAIIGAGKLLRIGWRPTRGLDNKQHYRRLLFLVSQNTLK